MDQNNTNNNKSNTLLIIVLLIIIVVFIGIILSNIIVKKDDKVVEKETPTTEQKTEQATDMEKELIDKVGIVSIGCSYYDNFKIEDLNSNLARLRTIYVNLDEKSFSNGSCALFDLKVNQYKSYCGDMSNEMQKYYSANDMNGFVNAQQKNTTFTIKPEAIENKAKELFGNDFKIKHESFGTYLTLNPDACYFMQYSKKNNIYGDFGCDNSNQCEPVTETSLSSSEESGNLIIKTEITDNTPVKKYATYTFKKENNNYILLNVKEGK